MFLKVELDIAAVLLDDFKDLFPISEGFNDETQRKKKYLERLDRDLQKTVSANLQFKPSLVFFIAATYLWPTMVASEYHDIVGSHSDGNQGESD